MPAAPDVLRAVVAALARVLERDVTEFSPELALADLGADSLVRVEVAELVEAALGGSWVITDERLDGALTVGTLAANFTSKPSSASKPSMTSTTSTGGDG